MKVELISNGKTGTIYPVVRPEKKSQSRPGFHQVGDVTTYVEVNLPYERLRTEFLAWDQCINNK